MMTLRCFGEEHRTERKLSVTQTHVWFSWTYSDKGLSEGGIAAFSTGLRYAWDYPIWLHTITHISRAIIDPDDDSNNSCWTWVEPKWNRPPVLATLDILPRNRSRPKCTVIPQAYEVRPHKNAQFNVYKNKPIWGSLVRVVVSFFTCDGFDFGGGEENEVYGGHLLFSARIKRVPIGLTPS